MGLNIFQDVQLNICMNRVFHEVPAYRHVYLHLRSFKYTDVEYIHLSTCVVHLRSYGTATVVDAAASSFIQLH